MVVSDSTPAFQLVPSAFLCHSISDILHQSVTPSLIQFSTQTLYHPVVITCCVRGKSSIKAQHGLGTADSCSRSSPNTSTKRQLSFTPKDVINWNSQEKKKAPETGEQSAQTQTSPPVVFKDAALLVHTDHTLETAESLGAAPDDDEDEARAALL